MRTLAQAAVSGVCADSRKNSDFLQGKNEM